MASRVVDGPEQDWLDMHDLTRLMRMSESTIRRLIKQGEFPRASETSPGASMWHWTDYLYWSLRAAIRPRLAVEKDPAAPES